VLICFLSWAIIFLGHCGTSKRQHESTIAFSLLDAEARLFVTPQVLWLLGSTLSSSLSPLFLLAKIVTSRLRLALDRNRTITHENYSF
jgi:hypothetical protein